MKTFLPAILAALCALFFAGCASLTSHEYNSRPLQVAIPDGVSSEKALRAAAQTFVNRQWSIVDRSDNSVTASLKHRTYDVEAKMTIEGGLISITIVESGKKDFDSKARYIGMKDDVPISWLENLQKDLRKNLQLAQF